MAADSGLLSILILLDLTAAVDTVSHTILLDRLASIGISDTPSLVQLISFWPYSLHSIENLHIPSISPLWCSSGLCPWPTPFYHLPPPSWSSLPKI